MGNVRVLIFDYTPYTFPLRPRRPPFRSRVQLAKGSVPRRHKFKNQRKEEE